MEVEDIETAPAFHGEHPVGPEVEASFGVIPRGEQGRCRQASMAFPLVEIEGAYRPEACEADSGIAAVDAPEGAACPGA